MSNDNDNNSHKAVPKLRADTLLNTEQIIGTLEARLNAGIKTPDFLAEIVTQAKDAITIIFLPSGVIIAPQFRNGELIGTLSIEELHTLSHILDKVVHEDSTVVAAGEIDEKGKFTRQPITTLGNEVQLTQTIPGVGSKMVN